MHYGLLALIAASAFAGAAIYITVAEHPARMLLCIMPTNRRLEATPPESAGEETRRLLERWGQLHAVRSVLGTGATLLFLGALWIAR